MSQRVPPDRTERARDLRNNSTRHERNLWRLISRYRPKFTRQLPIGPYTVDFACREARLVVELDGGHHADSAIDRHRDAILAQEGWSVLRIWNNQLDENPAGVFQAIMDRAAECLGGTHPTPPFQGGEGKAPPLRLMPSLAGRGIPCAPYRTAPDLKSFGSKVIAASSGQRRCQGFSWMSVPAWRLIFQAM